MTTIDRSKQMNLIHEDLARAHSGRRRWRGRIAPSAGVPRGSERVLVARLELARMLYGGHAR